MTPLVSVVIPVRNGGDYLREAVDSILSQSHENLELVLVDDHSTDDAVTRLGKGDARLNIINSAGSGVVEAFNTGFAHCKGEFIARMDADDISLPERLKNQLEYLEQHPSVAIAGCRVEIFSETGIQGGLERYERWLNGVVESEQVRQQIFIESPIPNPGAMFRRSVLQQLGGYRDVGWPEDYDLFLRADAANMRMGKPEAVLLRWREHATRITHTDPVYQRQQFMRAKTHFLVRYRLQGRPVVIWGAGPTGRLMHDLIVAESGQVEGFIEVHPRRIGGQKRGLPVWPIEHAGQMDEAMLLVAVGAAGARKEIRDYLQTHHKIEGQDYLFVA